MDISLVNYLPEIISVCLIAVFMSISPGADFVMVTRNSLFFNRKAGLYSALGISLAIWVHVAYSIAGLAIIISNSVVLFSIIKYLGAAYLIYIGWKAFRTKREDAVISTEEKGHLSNINACKIGFITNALNPKTTLFFLSIFTQVVHADTPIALQLLYGAIISLAHLIWFSLVAICLTQPIFLERFNQYKSTIEKLVDAVLVGFGLKVATTNLP